MLLRDRGLQADQDDIADDLLLPCSAAPLARRMTELSMSRWSGGTLADLPSSLASVVDTLTRSRGSWGALLEPFGFRSVGHWVVVDGIDSAGVVLVRDPVGQAYGIPLEEFGALWRYAILVIEEPS